MPKLVVVPLGLLRYRILWYISRLVRSSTSKITDRSYLSFPSTVMTSRVDPASPQGCHSILAIGADEDDAW